MPPPAAHERFRGKFLRCVRREAAHLLKIKSPSLPLLLGEASGRLQEPAAWSGEMMDRGDGNKACRILALLYLPAWLPIWKRPLTTGDSCSESKRAACSRRYSSSLFIFKRQSGVSLACLCRGGRRVSGSSDVCWLRHISPAEPLLLWSGLKYVKVC